MTTNKPDSGKVQEIGWEMESMRLEPTPQDLAPYQECFLRSDFTCDRPGGNEDIWGGGEETKLRIRWPL